MHVLHPRKQRIIENEGKDYEGVVTKYSKRCDPSDSEYDEYRITYEYNIGNKKYTNKDKFSICTAHLEWANHGGLIDTPKLMTTPSDLESKMQVGSKVLIKSARNNRYVSYEFEKHPNQIIDDEIWVEYRRSHPNNK